MDDLASLTPDKLFDRFDRGEIDRETLQSLMAIQARQLIREIEEDHLNPAAALLEHLRNIRAASKWVRRHGQKLMREILSTLARAEAFPPASLLWNASHPDLPLYCFFRTKREPVFRILRLQIEGPRIEIQIEYGRANPGFTQETFFLKRNASWELEIEHRAATSISPN